MKHTQLINTLENTAQQAIDLPLHIRELMMDAVNALAQPAPAPGPLTDEQIAEIAKPFIRSLGGDHWHSGEEGIRDNRDLEEFARAIERAALSQVKETAPFTVAAIDEQLGRQGYRTYSDLAATLAQQGKGAERWKLINEIEDITPFIREYHSGLCLSVEAIDAAIAAKGGA